MVFFKKGRRFFLTEKVCDHCYFSVIMCVVVVVGVVGVWGVVGGVGW